MRAGKYNRKGTSEVAGAIMALALILILGAIFMDTDFSYNAKQDYLDNKNSNSNGGAHPEETYLFYLNNTELGRQSKVTNAFPNVELGALEEENIIYVGNNFKLKANPFTSNSKDIVLSFERAQDINYFLVYFTPDRIYGDNDLIIKMNGREYYRNTAGKEEIPIIINPVAKFSENTSNAKIELLLDKPKFYSLFNWNNMEIKDIKVVEARQNKDNLVKTFGFSLNKDYLERVELNVVINCKETYLQKPIKVKVNGNDIDDITPDCTSRTNTFTKEIPKEFLKSDYNTLEMSTKGYYKMAYSVNKIYYNEDFTYKFNVNDFDGLIDVVMYGEFDQEVIDLKINEHLVSLGRDDIKSIVQYLRYGTNKIEFLTKPVEIEEFVIEKNEFLWD